MDKLYGLQFDFDDDGYLGLTVSAREGAALAFIPHQRAMLLSNALPRLLKLHIDSRNGVEKCCYDILGKRKLFPWLTAQQPPQQSIYEIAHRLVTTITDSNSLLLDENRYVLHEDYIFCGTSTTELALCYLPLIHIDIPPLSHSLRLILLKLLTCTKQLDNEHLPKVLMELSKERLDLYALREALKHVWLSYSAQPPQSVRLSDSSANGDAVDVHGEDLYGVASMETDVDQGGWVGRIVSKVRQFLETVRREGAVSAEDDRWKQYDEKKAEEATDQANHARVLDKTVNLDRTVVADRLQCKLIITNSDINQEQALPLDGDRFIIGRSKHGVHYNDVSEGVSRVHCEFVRVEEAWELRDLGSMNGTSLNGAKLVPFKSYGLTDGDIVTYVNVKMKFCNC